MSTHETLMRLALEEAGKAEALGEVPVGAVLVLEDGQLFTAHNAPIAEHDACAHAEIQLLRRACHALENYRLPKGATMYVTLEPCIMCAGAMLHARLSELVYAASEPKTGAVQSLYHILSDARLNHQVEIISGVLEEEARAQLQVFFKQRRKQNAAASSFPNQGL